MQRTVPIEVRGDVDKRAVEQLERCVAEGDAARGAICADGHVGYSMPIGGVVGYRGYVSPSGVGYDIACGNKAVATSLTYDDVKADMPRIMDEVFRRVPFGLGVPNSERVDAEVLDEIARSDYEPVRRLAQKAAAQLGSVGSGNHYVDLFREQGDVGRLWVGVHFGSRGFGHTVANGFLSLAQGGEFDEHPPGGEMDSPPVLLRTNAALGHLAADSVAASVRVPAREAHRLNVEVLDILGAEALSEVHNHHNFAWEEDHGGEPLWVVRKGATPAWPGQRGFVGATMGEPAAIVEGAPSLIETRASAAMESLLYSTVHGAGRVMSRTEAAGGRPKKRTNWECNAPGCRYVAVKGTHQPCPEHPDEKLAKRVSWEPSEKKGKINYTEVRERLEGQRIELRGGGADEAPEAYKRLPDVLAHHADTIRVVTWLDPVGVAMAGPDIKDPYKD